MKSILVLVLVALALGSPVLAQTSATQQGPILIPAPTATAPIWGKLILSGNLVTCYYATGTATPKTWTQIGQPQTVNFQNDPLLIGLFISSGNTSVVSTGTIDNFSISPAAPYRLQDVDIGAPGLMGSANLINGVWNISGTGPAIWGTSDQCNFQPWLVWTDCTVICRVTSLSSGSASEKIGIMIRDGYNSGSDFASFCVMNGNGVAFQYRPSFHLNSDGSSVATLVAPVNSSTSAGVAIGISPIGTNSSYYVLRP